MKKYYNYFFKVKDNNMLNEFKKRAKNLKEKGIIKDIFEIFITGLEVHERKDYETATINKKIEALVRRDKAITILIETNAEIEAYNRRLKNINPNRYKDLKTDDKVLKIYTEDNKDFLKDYGGYY